MSAMRTTLIAVTCLGLLAGCGSDPADKAAAKPKSFEEALGLDQASMQTREAKVQEAVRACMKAEGFEYIPMDPSQSGMVLKFGDGGEGLSMKERRKSGYGITSGPMVNGPRRRPTDDPNSAIRDALSEADRQAYDVALMGPEAANREKAGGGGMRVTRQVGESGPADQQGCMGKAQSEVPGGPQELGPDLKEMMDRAQSDPRLVAANRDWAACMADAGYTDFETPDDARDSIRDKLDALMGATPQGDGVTSFAIGGDDIDQAKLADLKQEEITVAVQDGKCQDETGYAKVAKKVRQEAEQRFLDEHPDLTSGS